ncbi:6-bladed beta-propeller [Bacteroides cutis]|uniref:6-bladed beta-propeller n=1 Tax=Bacteroides cutis TaxID=2024197 RepID=UPI000C76728F|nr:6-bladed beta-propeller [Bacteroides cutis]
MIRIAYVVFLLLFVSCSTSNKEVESVIVDFSEESSLSASDLLSVSYVKLETGDDYLLAGGNQCTNVGDRYILLDNIMARTLYAFNLDGSFVQQIGKKGNGPGEYINPFEYSVNERDKTLSVIDIEQQKIIVYSLADFRFLSEKKMPFYSDYMEQLPNGDYVWYNKLASDASDSYAFITDKDLNIKKSFIPIDFSSGYSLGTSRKLYKQGDEVSLYTPFNPVLYRVKSDSIYPAFQFKFGEKKLPPIDFLKEKSANNKNYIPDLLESPYVAFYNVYESDQLLCVPYYMDKTMYFGFYDKKKNISYNFSQDKLQSELQIGAFSSPIGVTQDGSFISLLRPGLLLQLQEKGNKINDELIQLLNESTEEDNPILLIYSLKK